MNNEVIILFLSIYLVGVMIACLIHVIENMAEDKKWYKDILHTLLSWIYVYVTIVHKALW